MSYISPFLLLQAKGETVSNGKPAALGGTAVAPRPAHEEPEAGSSDVSVISKPGFSFLGGVASTARRAPAALAAGVLPPPQGRSTRGDLNRIGHMGPTPARQRKIAEAYEKVGKELDETVGVETSFAKYAAWGARQVAEDLPDDLEQRTALLDSYRSVFTEVTSAMQSFVETFRRDGFNDPAKLTGFLEKPELQGRPEVRSAMLLLHQAKFSGDPEEKTRLAKQADGLLAVFESERLNLELEQLNLTPSVLTESLLQLPLPKSVIELGQEKRDPAPELARLRSFLPEFKPKARSFFRE